MRHLDLFSGIGGFALGLARAGGFETVGFVEIDDDARAVLRDWWPEVPIHDDIRSVRGGECGPVDILTGGFPCQPWSMAGRRRGAADDRDLWPEMRRIAAACRPRWIVAENVPGIVRPKLGLARVLADLGTLGYSCVTLGVPAAGVGAPHLRERVWIVAHAEGERRQGGSPAGQRERPPAERLRTAGPGELCLVADGLGAGLEGRAGRAVDGERAAAERGGEGGAWAGAVRLVCADGKARRVEPGVRLLAHGLSGRVAALRLLGNAIVPQVAERLGRAILAADAESA